MPSRRFGRSLGIDLTPHKTCSLDCAFCQLGRTPEKTLERKAYVPTADVIAEIDHWLQTDGNADYLTLSGSGEPTLHSEFGHVLAFLREQPIPTVLLANGTLLNLPELRSAAALSRELKPDRIHLNTIARPPAEDIAAAVPMERLEELVGWFDPPAQIAAVFNGKQSKTLTANAAKSM